MGDERCGTSALLGPTNTGKTHRAVERMLEHRTGMIGLPLRLLAREIYDRVSVRVGERAVALITGEEKRIPPRPRYWVCTVESMPVERTVDFLAVDEVQLAAHPQRGHVFTDRLLHARGRLDTWFMGADTMRPMVEQLVPTAEIRRHPRMSTLRAGGALGLSALPPRSALIAFSAADVYQLADKLRRRRGGAAVVLGALSPRTRNAQVAMYQAGEVDFLVATDAIGMGLNMDVDHVAFSSMRKFDGSRKRSLSAAEFAQIAGRAGRHTRDGTFGTVTPLQLPSNTAFAIERHRFAPVRQVVWRNADVDTSSVEALIASLKVRPPSRRLVMVEKADDFAVLLQLCDKPEIAERARGAEAVSLLWEVCRIPDFRKLLVEHHASLLAEIYLQLSGAKATIDPDFMHSRVGRLEDDRGDIDALMMRMEFIRTWNYIAHRGDWVADAEAWQQRTQRCEDRLSEALHLKLIERFVEGSGRRARRARPRGRSRPSSPKDAAQRHEAPAPSGPFSQLAALRDALSPEVEVSPPDEWVEQLVDADHERFSADAVGRVLYSGAEGALVDEPVEVAALTRGVDIVHPEVKLRLVGRHVGAGSAARILRRMRAWTRDFVDLALASLRDPRVEQLSPAANGLLYQLEQGLGSIAAEQARPQVKQLTDEDKTILRELGVQLGRRFVFVDSLHQPASIARRAALCAAHFGPRTASAMGASFKPERKTSAELLAAHGFALLGGIAVRVDVVERLDARLHELSRGGAFHAPDELASWLEGDADTLERVVIAMGYHHTEEGFVRPRKRRRRRGRSSRKGRRPGRT